MTRHDLIDPIGDGSDEPLETVSAATDDARLDGTEIDDEGGFVASAEPDFDASAEPDFDASAEPDFVASAEPDFVASAEPDFVASAEPDFVATPVVTGNDSATEPAEIPTVRPRDPIATGLLVFALGLVFALLLTTGALYIFLTTLNRAPRTVAEREVAAGEAAVSEQPKQIAGWISLAYAYARAERYQDALDTVGEGVKHPKSEEMHVVRADILRMAGRHEEAVKAYDAAMKEVEIAVKRLNEERTAAGVTSEFESDLPYRVYIGRAFSKRELGDKDGALKDFVVATKENPTQVDIWVQLGDLYAEKGRNAEAIKAYESALVYAPDYAAAQEGLAKVRGD